MRELTLEELELVAGGTDTGDIVVYGGDGGGDWGGGDWGWGGGDYGGGGGDGGGGGGGGDGGSDTSTSYPPIQTTDGDGNTFTIEPKYDPATKNADLIVTAANPNGYMSINFDLNSFNVDTITLSIGNFTGTAYLSNGMVDGTWQFHNFSSPDYQGTLYMSLGTNGDAFKVSIGGEFKF